MRACPNCGTTNPKYSSSCTRCNAPLSSAEQERRERRRILNEQREANGKDPLPVEETDESVEPVEGSGADLVFFALIVLLTVAVVGALALGVIP